MSPTTPQLCSAPRLCHHHHQNVVRKQTQGTTKLLLGFFSRSVFSRVDEDGTSSLTYQKILTVRWTSQQNDLLLKKENNTETLFSLWIRWKMTHKRLRTEVVKSKWSKQCHRRRAETRNKKKTKDTGTDWLCKAPRNADGHLSDAASRSAAQGMQQKKLKPRFGYYEKIGKHPVRIATCGPETARGATRVTLIMFKRISTLGSDTAACQRFVCGIATT